MIAKVFLTNVNVEKRGYNLTSLLLFAVLFLHALRLFNVITLRGICVRGFGYKIPFIRFPKASSTPCDKIRWRWWVDKKRSWIQKQRETYIYIYIFENDKCNEKNSGDFAWEVGAPHFCFQVVNMDRENKNKNYYDYNKDHITIQKKKKWLRYKYQGGCVGFFRACLSKRRTRVAIFSFTLTTDVYQQRFFFIFF